MTEGSNSATDTTAAAPPASDKVRVFVSISYIFALFLLSFVLLVSRTELAKLSTDGWLLLLFLILSLLCGELSFSLGPDVTADLSGLFNSAAALTLGFNGVWVSSLSNLYFLLVKQRDRWESQNIVSLLANNLMNLSLNTLPPWLGLFVYHDLLRGQLPLANLEANLAPALAFVLVEWATQLAAGFIPLLIAWGGLSRVAEWFKSILTGYALSFFVPTLFSLAVAVILNRLGLGFFAFVTAGLLGVSLMAQRLARSLETERRRVQELTALNALSDDIIHSPPGGAATGDLLVQHAPRFIPNADFELGLFDAKTPEHRQVAARWRDGAAQPAAEEPVTPLWSWLRDQRQPLHVADVSQASLPFNWNEESDGPRPGSLLLVPLLAADPDSSETERCLGGLLLTHTRRDAFDKALPSVTALAHQLAAALENARLYQDALARERLERELVLARGIQTSFLPAGVPDLPGWAFAASLEPARHVSGDFYDFIPLPGERLGVLIADVADKGMPSALYMALTRTLIRAHAPDYPDDPARCLRAVNDQILSDTQADSFVTVFYGVLDVTTGEMAFTNAGHNPPYLCQRNGDSKLTPLRTAGMPLGILPGVELGQEGVRFRPGDYLVLYTDGVTEAHDQKLKEFGDDRLLAEIQSLTDATVETAHRRIYTAVQEFVGDAPQFDDLTLMVVGRER